RIAGDEHAEPDARRPGGDGGEDRPGVEVRPARIARSLQGGAIPDAVEPGLFEPEPLGDRLVPRQDVVADDPESQRLRHGRPFVSGRSGRYGDTARHAPVARTEQAL